jgi:hypothetical protein
MDSLILFTCFEQAKPVSSEYKKTTEIAKTGYVFCSEKVVYS